MYRAAPSVLLLVLSLCHICSNVIAVAVNQQPLEDPRTQGSDIIDALIRAEIIPTVIDTFHPSLLLSVNWSKKKDFANLGNTIKPKRLQHRPHVSLHELTSTPPSLLSSHLQFIVILTDPDAPSREDPKWSEMCHWIATDVSISDDPPPAPVSTSVNEIAFVDFDVWDGPKHEEHHQKHHHEVSGIEEIMPYKPPGPPPKTGKHRYVFLAFAPANATHERLNLTEPADRMHWGYEGERMGVRQWAVENGLVPVAANFIYSQNKKQ